MCEPQLEAAKGLSPDVGWVAPGVIVMFQNILNEIRCPYFVGRIHFLGPTCLQGQLVLSGHVLAYIPMFDTSWQCLHCSAQPFILSPNNAVEQYHIDTHTAGRCFSALKTTFLPSLACLAAASVASGNCVNMRTLLVQHLA